MRPLHPCGVSSCPHLTDKPRCPEHTVTREERNPKDPAQAKFYGSVQWKTLRKIVKSRDPICKICHQNPTTQADHIDEDWQNNELSNLQGVCTSCHNSKSGRQHYWRRVPLRPKLEPFVVLVGQAGVGKSTIAKHLAPMLNAIGLGPDDYQGDWTQVYHKLDHSPRAIVECCTLPGKLSRTAAQRGAFIVELTLPDHLRRQRLMQRHHTPDHLAQLMAMKRRLGYEQDVVPNLILDTSSDPKQIAQTIVSELSRWRGAQR